jgi:uncharacterized membrane protein YkvA (DUF1232 family)
VLELFRLVVIGGFLIVMTFLILLALPQCRLREILMPFVAWGFVVLCGVYAISPVDILPEIVLGPFGLVDDLAAVVAGVGTAVSTIQAQKRKANG